MTFNTRRFWGVTTAALVVTAGTVFAVHRFVQRRWLRDDVIVRVHPIDVPHRHLPAALSSQRRVEIQQELEFTATALACYIRPAESWTNKYGQRLRLSDLCEALCQEPLGSGACFGLHNVNAVAVLLAVDAQQTFLPAHVRTQARRRLLCAVERLWANQRPSGGWDKKWHVQDTGSTRPVATVNVETPDAIEIVATSHALECLAILPNDVPIHLDAVDRAIRRLVTIVLSASQVDIDHHFVRFSHVGTAVKTWCPAAWIAFVESRHQRGLDSQAKESS